MSSKNIDIDEPIRIGHYRQDDGNWTAFLQITGLQSEEQARSAGGFLGELIKAGTSPTDPNEVN